MVNLLLGLEHFDGLTFSASSFPPTSDFFSPFRSQLNFLLDFSAYPAAEMCNWNNSLWQPRDPLRRWVTVWRWFFFVAAWEKCAACREWAGLSLLVSIVQGRGLYVPSFTWQRNDIAWNEPRLREMLDEIEVMIITTISRACFVC